ncbi:MAG: peptidylprolyl isomerase [Bacteroidetes bacterium MedPE-SWsnd-G2]|nr:MAG: peptidylprolyl isomerase [Bacteroidetes bacterium MedPE-SWsnd-G2]
MAVLNKIRQRSLFLILIIALALFSFVLADLFRNSDALANGSQDTVATINGKDISRVEFVGQVESMRRNMGPNGSDTQAMNSVWNREVRKAVLETEYEALGLSVEKDQMRSIMAASLASNPEFLNEDGIFDENRLNEFIANLKAIQGLEAPNNRAPFGNGSISYSDWINYENSLATTAMQTTYVNMIKAGVNATLGEAEANYIVENKNVDLKYVNIPYSSIADSLVQVSKSDINAYVKAHKSEFEVEESRDFKFVYFQEVASLEDETNIQNELKKLLEDREEFNNTTKATEVIKGFNTTSDIEAFVNANSNEKFNDNFVPKSALPVAFQDTIFNLEVNGVFGPYKDNGQFKITKLIAERQLPDSVKIRHILIPHVGARNITPDVVQTEAQAKATADSVLTIVKSNRSKFPELVTALSSDPGSVDNGGEYDFHGYGTMVKPFNDFEFENKVGDMEVVKTDFGFHVIEILGQRGESKLVKVATLAEKIEPSEETVDAVYYDASKFELAIKDGDFDEIAKASNYVVRPVNSAKVLDENIPTVGSQRQIVKWTFDKATKVGDAKRFDVPGGFVIAELVAKHDAGLMSAEAASAAVLPKIRNEKKAEMIRAKITATNLDDLAANNKQSVRTSSAVNMKTPTISGAGQEPLVVGTAFGLAEGATSGLIDGVKGVYMIQVTKINDVTNLDNYQAMANRLSRTRTGAAQGKVFQALEDAAEIEDNRATFY